MLRFALIALLVYGAIVMLRRIRVRREPDLKCETCAHRRKLFHDGAMCGFEDKEAFKNPVQIGMCPNHEVRNRR